MAKKFLNLTGLTTLLIQLVRVFAPAAEVAEVEDDTKNYVTEIDYESTLKFDTNWIVGDNAPYVGSASVGQTYVA